MASLDVAVLGKLLSTFFGDEERIGGVSFTVVGGDRFGRPLPCLDLGGHNWLLGLLATRWLPFGGDGLKLLLFWVWLLRLDDLWCGVLFWRFGLFEYMLVFLRSWGLDQSERSEVLGDLVVEASEPRHLVLQVLVFGVLPPAVLLFEDVGHISCDIGDRPLGLLGGVLDEEVGLDGASGDLLVFFVGKGRHELFDILAGPLTCLKKSWVKLGRHLP